jgi:hypothetical protein
MDEFLVLVVVAAIAEAAVQTIKLIFSDFKSNWHLAVAVVLVSVIAWAAQLSLLSLFKVNLFISGEYSRILNAGLVGLIGGRGATFVHDFYAGLSGFLNKKVVA